MVTGLLLLRSYLARIARFTSFKRGGIYMLYFLVFLMYACNSFVKTTKTLKLGVLTAVKCGSPPSENEELCNSWQRNY